MIYTFSDFLSYPPRQGPFTVKDPLNSANDSQAILDWVAVGQPVFMKLADFDRDGYDDVLLMTSTSGNTSAQAQIYTARCSGDPDLDCSSTQGPADGLVSAEVPPLVLPQLGHSADDPAIGDFNGDGIEDVVWGVSNLQTKPQGPNDLRFASVCPAAGSTLFTRQDLCDSPLQIVLPAQDALPLPNSTTFDIVNIALATGNFDGQVNAATGLVTDELLIVST